MEKNHCVVIYLRTEAKEYSTTSRHRYNSWLEDKNGVNEMMEDRGFVVFYVKSNMSKVESDNLKANLDMLMDYIGWKYVTRQRRYEYFKSKVL